MSLAIDKILFYLTAILLFALFIGTNATNVDHNDVQLKHDQNLPEYAHHIGKRRFLPTRSETYQFINGDINESKDDHDNHDDDDADDNAMHFNAKRYFLKSKRYFLNSKRSADQKNE